MEEKQSSSEVRKKKREVSRKLEAIGWGAFFIWIGVVMLVGVPVGWALTVVRLITLGGQLGRHAFGLRAEGFWRAFGSAAAGSS